MLKTWEDHITRLEKILTAEGEKASAFHHAGTKGSVREYFLSKFLEDFLPETIGVGQGEVFDRDDRRSKQMDIILFDKSYPVIKVDKNSWIFPVESVIALIEVKTELNSTTLADALDNSLSLLQLRPRQARLLLQGVPPPGEPSAQDYDWLYPSTYVVAYSGYTSDSEALTKVIIKWFGKNIEKIIHVPFPRLMLPRVVVTPTAFWFRKADNLKIANETDGSDRDFAATVSDSAFRIFVADLLYKVIRRSTSVRIDYQTKTQWCSIALEDFDIASCLETKSGWTTGKLFHDPDPIAEREFDPAIRIRSTGYSLEPCPHDTSYKWVRSQGLLMGRIRKATEGVYVEFLEQMEMDYEKQKYEAEFRKGGFMETETQAVALLGAKLPTNKYRFSQDPIPFKLRRLQDHPDKTFVFYKNEDRCLGYYSLKVNNNEIPVSVSLGNDQTNFRSIGTADSEEDAILKILDHDGLRTGFFQYQRPCINRVDQ